MFYGGLAGGVLITGLAGQSASLAAGLPLRLDHHDLGGRRLGHHRPGRRRRRDLHRAGAPAVRGGPGRGVRPGRGAQGRRLQPAVAVLAAVTVTVAMRTVGLLLVSALMVVPVATAQQLTRSFRTTLAVAMLLGIGASVGGLLLAAYRLVPRQRRARPHHRAAGAGRLRAAWPLGVLAAVAAAAADAVRAGGAGRARRHRGTSTCTARTADTWPSSTATTSTTSTAATGTRPTESTMTSTDRSDRRRGHRRVRPSSGWRCWPSWSSSTSSARAQEIHELLADSGIGLATVYRTLQLSPTPARSTCCAARTARRSTGAAPTPTTTTWSAARAAPPSRWRVRPSSAGPRAIGAEHGFSDISHTLETGRHLPGLPLTASQALDSVRREGSRDRRHGVAVDGGPGQARADRR